MRRELKIRIDSLTELEERILHAGGRRLGSATYEYIYFNQPEGDVLKITKKPEGVFKTVIKAREDGQFDIVSSDQIENEAEVIENLTAMHGIKRSLVNHRTFFALAEDELSLNEIENVGIFLIIESEHPDIETARRLGISHPEIITVSFDNL